MVSAGVELAAYRLLDTDRDARSPRGTFHVRLSGAELAVSYVTEAARVDLNAAPKELMAGLLSVLGASEEDAKTTADRIMAWRTRAASNSAGNENALYRSGGILFAAPRAVRACQ